VKKALRTGKRKAPVGRSEPHVGIFWLLKGKLIMDTTPLTKAEDYDDFKIHPASHIDVWARLQRSGIASAEMVYEEAPRGRVAYNTKTQRFTLLADKCILEDERIVEQIVSELTWWRKATDFGRDPHYRCFACLNAGQNEL
jgi:hypothetical protein